MEAAQQKQPPLPAALAARRAREEISAPAAGTPAASGNTPARLYARLPVPRSGQASKQATHRLPGRFSLPVPRFPACYSTDRSSAQTPARSPSRWFAQPSLRYRVLPLLSTDTGAGEQPTDRQASERAHGRTDGRVEQAGGRAGERRNEQRSVGRSIEQANRSEPPPRRRPLLLLPHGSTTTAVIYTTAIATVAAAAAAMSAAAAARRADSTRAVPSLE